MQRHLLHKTWHAVLSGRGVLALEGRDTHKLLQGLVTSDVTALEEGGQPQHTAFLAHNGRMLFDAFLIPGPTGSVLIEAEAAAIPALAAHLRRYKLRSKVMTITLPTVHCALCMHCACTVHCACTHAHAHMHMHTCTCTVRRRSTACAQVTFTDRTEEFAVVAICGHDAAASAAAAMTPESGMPYHAGLEPRTSRQGPRHKPATHTFEPCLGQARRGPTRGWRPLDTASWYREAR
jgi:glycine cleavage system aminomethyltransferase T